METDSPYFKGIAKGKSMGLYGVHKKHPDGNAGGVNPRAEGDACVAPSAQVPSCDRAGRWVQRSDPPGFPTT